MRTCPNFGYLIVLPRLKVQNANAVSSPLTHGFPSMTAFLGLMWALERKSRAVGIDLAFKAVGAVCHHYEEQVHGGSFVKAFRLTRNPIGKDGDAAAIVEEGRIHLEISLLLAVDSPNWGREPETISQQLNVVADLVAGMRIAGGTVLSPTRPMRSHDPYLLNMTGTEEDCQSLFRKARFRLLPGFTLVSRDDRLEERLAELQAQNPAVGRLDAWLSLSRFNWHYQSDERTANGKWINDRSGKGWLVPIPVGYRALGDLNPAGSVANSRDKSTPFRFVESLYSIGEWVSPHRLALPRDLLWYADYESATGLYRCRNDYTRIHEIESEYNTEFALD